MTDADLVTIDQRIQRAGAANCWTGTLGSLAGDARRLVRHIQETRRMAEEYPVDHILRGERELKHFTGDEVEPEATLIEEPEGPPVAVQLLDTARAAVLDRHRVYGPPDEHFARTAGAINALFGSILRRPITAADWGRMMIVDKLARDMGPRPHADNPVDMAGYAACVASCLASAPPADRAT